MAISRLKLGSNEPMMQHRKKTQQWLPSFVETLLTQRKDVLAQRRPGMLFVMFSLPTDMVTSSYLTMKNGP
jgi:hypothetical protein